MKVEYLTEANATKEDLIDITKSQNRYIEELVTEIVELKDKLTIATYTPAVYDEEGVLKKMARTTLKQKIAAVQGDKGIKWYEDKLVLREY